MSPERVATADASTIPLPPHELRKATAGREAQRTWPNASPALHARPRPATPSAQPNAATTRSRRARTRNDPRYRQARPSDAPTPAPRDPRPSDAPRAEPTAARPLRRGWPWARRTPPRPDAERTPTPRPRAASRRSTTHRAGARERHPIRTRRWPHRRAPPPRDGPTRSSRTRTPPRPPNRTRRTGWPGPGTRFPPSGRAPTGARFPHRLPKDGSCRSRFPASMPEPGRSPRA